VRPVKSLPMLPVTPTCPAAVPIVGAMDSQQGVVCRVMQRDHVEDPGLNMGTAATGFIHHEASGGVYLNLKSDPSTVTKFCHGDAVPVLHDGDHQGRASYTYCPTWQAEKLRIAEGRDHLLDEPELEPVAAGVSVEEYRDPFGRDLEMFGEAA
jgi:hypothetical protein